MAHCLKACPNFDNLQLLSHLEIDSKNTLAQQFTADKKNLQFFSDLTKILAALPNHWLIILTKFDDHWTKM